MGLVIAVLGNLSYSLTPDYNWERLGGASGGLVALPLRHLAALYDIFAGGVLQPAPGSAKRFPVASTYGGAVRVASRREGNRVQCRIRDQLRWCPKQSHLRSLRSHFWENDRTCGVYDHSLQIPKLV